MKNTRLLVLVAVLAVMAGAFFLSSPGFRGPGLVQLPDEAAGRVGIQYLMAQLCSACRDMEPVLEEVKEAYGDRVFIQTVDVHARPGTIRAYGIRIVPSVVIFDRGGEVRFRNEGVMSAQELFLVLDDILRDHGQEA